MRDDTRQQWNEEKISTVNESISKVTKMCAFCLKVKVGFFWRNEALFRILFVQQLVKVHNLNGTDLAEKVRFNNGTKISSSINKSIFKLTQCVDCLKVKVRIIFRSEILF